MTSENLKKSIRNEKIELTFSEKWSYYFLCIGLIGFLIMFGYFYVDTILNDGNLYNSLIILIVLTVLVIIVSYYKLNQNLRLFKISTRIDSVKLFEIIQNFYSKEKYEIYIQEENLIEGTVFYNLGLHRIEENFIFILENRMLYFNVRTTDGINGILYDFGITTRNVKGLIEIITNASRQQHASASEAV